MILVKQENENEEQYLWRLGNAKDSGLIDLSWDDIADLMNKYCRSEEDEYRTASAYRKPYQQAKRFFDSKVFTISEDEYIVQLTSARASENQRRAHSIKS